MISSQLGRVAYGKEDPLYRCESRLISLLMNIILAALDNGDLHLRDHQGPSELAFTLWSLAFGARALMDTGVATRQLGIEDGFKAVRNASDLLLDALHWQPVSGACDYASVRAQIRHCLFAGEYASLQV